MSARRHAEGLVVCECGWRSIRGLDCEGLTAAYRAHRVLVGLDTPTLAHGRRVPA